MKKRIEAKLRYRNAVLYAREIERWYRRPSGYPETRTG